MENEGGRAPSSRGPLTAVAAPAVTLVVVSPTGTAHFALPARGLLVVGRSTECDVTIDDAKLSRRHAEIRSGDALEVVDLGSLNGTYVRDEKLQPNVPRRLRVGDAISIGSTMIALQRTADDGRPRNVWSHGYFEARLTQECARAAQEKTQFAVLRVYVAPESATAPTNDGSSSGASLFAMLEAADMIASYAPQEYEALYANTTADEADRRAAEVQRALVASTGSRVAVAVFPRDGRGPEALIEHASRALRARGGVQGSERRTTPTSPPPATGALERMAAIVARVAAGSINVLILGETGAGKEVLARRLHDLSPRAQMPLVTINCAALSETLLESELFGYEKGAFTGAVAAKAGLLESAHGGIVFLDEVGEMPLATQAKLLRALEQREVMRVGALRPRTIDVRFFAATNRDLDAEVAHGRFRQDLFFRLNGIALSLPPLRERLDEIEPLALGFVEHAARVMGMHTPPTIGADALEALRAYAWPGNIRELRNVMERAVLLVADDVITCAQLPMDKIGAHRSTHRAPAAGHEPPALAASLPTLPPEGDERQRIVAALEKCAGSQSNAAKLLGISRATLIRRLDEYAIPRPRKRE